VSFVSLLIWWLFYCRSVGYGLSVYQIGSLVEYTGGVGPPYSRCMSRLPDLKCLSCGEDAGRKPNGRRRKTCLPCAIDASARAGYEMFIGAGVAYDRWLSSKGPAGRPPRSQQEE